MEGIQAAIDLVKTTTQSEWALEPKEETNGE
jgi:hypothetical protein